MTTIPSLFDPEPYEPAVVTRRTAQAASRAVMRERVLWYLGHRPGTPDQVAERAGLSILSVRPAMTQLKQDGMIEPTGSRFGTGLGATSAEMRLTALGHQTLRVRQP